MSASDKYGLNITFSAVYSDDDTSEVALTVKDSDGLHVESYQEGDDIDEILTTLFDDIVGKVLSQEDDEKAEIDCAKLQEQIQSLTIDNNILEERVSYLQQALDASQHELEETKKQAATKKAAKKSVDVDPLGDLYPFVRAFFS